MPGQATLVRERAVEYAAASDVIGTAAAATGVARAEIRGQLALCGERIASLLKLGASPFAIDDAGLRVAGVAGLVRVSPFFELELVPKFLDHRQAGWREDFFYLATLSRHGRLLPAEQLGAGTRAESDLATLVARAMIGMYWANHRRPLRTYRRQRVQDFAVDGDVEPDSVFLPEAEGFDQQVIRYTRQNDFNATISAASQSLLPEVSDPQTRRQLVRLCEVLAPQAPPRSSRHRAVPSRAKRWQSLFDLALEVLDGFGVSFTPGRLRAPGYVLSTWQMWEDLVTLALRLGLGSARVAAQVAAPLGDRTIRGDLGVVKHGKVWVTPDIVFREDAHRAPVLIDAKYKARTDVPRTRIGESDIYEALAFASAAGATTVILVYPAAAVVPADTAALGSCREFERITVSDVSVIGIAVESSGISKTGGLRTFSAGLATGIRHATAETR